MQDAFMVGSVSLESNAGSNNRALFTAGLGDLSLVQRLEKVRITFHVLKRDLTMNYSAQGYRAWIGSEGLIGLKNTLPPET